MNRPTRAGFSLIELLVVIAIILMLTGIIVPTFYRMAEMTRQKVCGTRLHGIGQGAISYATSNQGVFPSFKEESSDCSRVGYRRDDRNPGTARSNTRGWFSMIRTEHCDLMLFCCPADDLVFTDSYKTSDIYDFKAFDDRTPLSYSMQRTKMDVSGDTPKGVLLTLQDDSDLPIGADHNGNLDWEDLSTSYAEVSGGGGDENSMNHSRAGQNVMRLGGSVFWATSPKVGLENDNIYDGQNGSPLSAEPEEDKGKLVDSVLTP